jgi:GTPase Era involved in 16S rRNA processing
MSTPIYSQEQFDIALLKQQSSMIFQTLDRIEREMITGFNKVDKVLQEQKTELQEQKTELKTELKEQRIEHKEQRKELLGYIKWLYVLYISGFGSLFGIIAHKFGWF